MDKRKIIYEIIKIVCTAIISIAAVLTAQSCTMSLSVSKNNSNSTQKTEQTTTSSVDSTQININPKKLKIMDLKEAFRIRKKDAETDDVIITIGNHLATEQVFKSEEEAQKVIDATDWNLVIALIYACKEADQWEEKQKETSKKEE